MAEHPSLMWKALGLNLGVARSPLVFVMGKDAFWTNAWLLVELS